MNYLVTRRDLAVVVQLPEALDPSLVEETGEAPAIEAVPEPRRNAVVNDLPPAVLAIVGTLYVAMVALFWLGFGGPVDAASSLGIASFVILMFIAIPFAMAKTGKLLPKRLGEGLRALEHGSIETATGTISGRTALILVLTVPVCLTLGAAAIALIFRLLS